MNDEMKMSDFLMVTHKTTAQRHALCERTGGE